MKSLISRIITQSGIEPFYFADDIGKCHPRYTESQVYEIAEKVAKQWAVEKIKDYGLS